ncbi:hypothetical protein K440DRAFT_535768 [Wilcoxina mikolae CBS 423.85]|nr:hypothetical protein K440DRAFT_535768 [Wilcoxina mikolae CBS 423.85]
MKRSYDDANGSTTSSISGSPPACEISPTYGRKRRSTSPPIPNNSIPPPVPSVFTDASGRITRIPTISRKVRACSACKKQKIRCDFEDGQSTCLRCKKMKLECVVNRSLQTILDEDVEWKHKMRDDTIQLQRALGHVLAVLNMRPLASYCPGMSQPTSQFQESQPNPVTLKLEDEQSSHRAGISMARENSQAPEEHDGQALFSNPIGSLYEVTRLRGLRGGAGNRLGARTEEMDVDFVSRGLVSPTEAQELFTIFRDNLSQYLYRIALVHDDLESARSSSSLLTAAIFTVTALHVPRHHHLFTVLYREFLNIISTCMFDRYHRLDDVRGLCIGAFWLTEISWKLSGHAVRIATEMNIHQAFHNALAGSRQHFEQARLWYLLYVCDHHFSIGYGRPPLIRDHEPMRKWDLYLQSSMATEGDYLILSQVTLFGILTRIFHFFEDEAENEICEDRLGHIPVFNDHLENWRETWRSRLPNHINPVGDHIRKGVDLHYHWAKLQLNSMVLRGANPSTGQLSSRRKDHANIAITSAIAILSIVLEEPSIRDTLVGAPLFINTMVSSAASFLLKFTEKWKSVSFNIAPRQVWSLVERVIALLNTNSRGASEHHIVTNIASGLEKMLCRIVDSAKSSSPVNDSRLWGGSVQEGPVLVDQQAVHSSPHEQTHGTGSALTSYTVGHGQQQQQQQQYWQTYQNQHAQHSPGHEQIPSEVLYSQNSNPQGSLHSSQQAQQQMYEVNGQYFPVQAVGVFDFLSPQLPY